ncbi:MAG: tripartite tricarboxylate transporter substrate binding protein [Synergistaceae bacterium]|jgi:putative tricarboxylic transport membrane protein|nr:tripartite tricarboxylate transporter substrate binding protein [Synergistaceae bacterium]
MFRKLVLAAILAAFFAGPALADFPSEDFECVAPSEPGGGWDITIRAVAKVLTSEKIITNAMRVISKPGAGGGVGLSYIKGKKNPHTIAVYSPPLLLINLMGQTRLSYRNLTPLAMLTNDFGAFAVRKDSPYQTVNDLFDALKKDPGSVSISGTSVAGGIDHIQFLHAARAAGVDAGSTSYITFARGGALAALLDGRADVFTTTGIAEITGSFVAGDIRILAITSAERAGEGPFASVPTLREQGVDAVFIIWRGIFGIPDMPEEARLFMESALKKMSETPMWADVCKRNNWIPAFMGSADFTRFLEKTNEEYKSTLASIGFYKQD